MNLERLLDRSFQHFRQNVIAGITSLTFSALSCAPAGPQACKVDNECPSPGLCIENYCNNCVTDNDCPTGKVCQEKVCVGQGSSSYTNKGQVTAGGINIKVSTSNQNGQVFFNDDQSGEKVTINLQDELGKSVVNAEVIFWDGNGFEAYQVFHDSKPYLFIKEHNSEHTFNLNSAVNFVCSLFDGSSNDNSRKAARKFLDQVQSVGTKPGCVRREDLEQALDEQTNAIMDLFDYTGKVGGLMKPIFACSKRLLIDIPHSLIDKGECPAYDTWLAHPTDVISKKGNISPILGISNCKATIPPESCANGIDDDCNGKIDKDDPACKTTIKPTPGCTDNCNSVGQKQCVGNSVKTCGNYDADSCLEWSSGEYCANGCASDATCKSSSSKFQDLGNGTVKQTNTGWIWQKNSPSEKMTLAKAKAYCSTLSLAGRSWQLPTIDNFLSMTSPYKPNTCNLPSPFTGTCNLYWTSHPCTSTANKEFPFNGSSEAATCSQDQVYVRCISK